MAHRLSLHYDSDSIEVLLDQFKGYLSDADLVKVEWPLLCTGIFEL